VLYRPGPPAAVCPWGGRHPWDCHPWDCRPWDCRHADGSAGLTLALAALALGRLSAPPWAAAGAAAVAAVLPGDDWAGAPGPAGAAASDVSRALRSGLRRRFLFALMLPLDGLDVLRTVGLRRRRLGRRSPGAAGPRGRPERSCRHGAGFTTAAAWPVVRGAARRFGLLDLRSEEGRPGLTGCALPGAAGSPLSAIWYGTGTADHPLDAVDREPLVDDPLVDHLVVGDVPGPPVDVDLAGAWNIVKLSSRGARNWRSAREDRSRARWRRRKVDSAEAARTEPKAAAAPSRRVVAALLQETQADPTRRRTTPP